MLDPLIFASEVLSREVLAVTVTAVLWRGNGDVVWVGQQQLYTFQSTTYLNTSTHTCPLDRPWGRYKRWWGEGVRRRTIALASDFSHGCRLRATKLGRRNRRRDGCEAKDAGGPATNTSFNGNRLGWMDANLPRRGWCKIGRTKTQVLSQQHLFPLVAAWSPPPFRRAFISAVRSEPRFTQPAGVEWHNVVLARSHRHLFNLYCLVDNLTRRWILDVCHGNFVNVNHSSWNDITHD